MTEPLEPANGPAPCDVAIVGGRILDLAEADGVATGDTIAIVGAEIVAVGRRAEVLNDWRPAHVIDATDQIVSPGFVDAHVHLSAFLGAGQPYVQSDGPGLFSGAARTAEIVPMVTKMCAMEVPTDLVATIVRPVLAAMVRAGFTSVVDAGSAGHRGLVVAATDIGIRAAIGPSLADCWHDDQGRLDRRADPAALVARAEELIAEIDGAGDGRVRGLISGVETIACSDDLLAGIAQLAEQLDVPTHIHTDISEPSVRDHMEAYGASPGQRLLAAGLLTSRCTVMHVGYLDDDEVALFAGTGVTANHNPLGNAMLGFGTVAGRAIPRLIDAGVPVVLGSDYAPSMIASPFDLMRSALMVHREAAAADDALTLEQVLAMSTQAGVAVGRPGRLGRIAPGQLADLVCIDTTQSHHLGTTHAVPGLALRARPDDVTTTVVNGRVVVQDRQLVDVDEAHVLAEARAALSFIK
jgi:5-methylthioadenosine/S-adenosylhomocysteine deaminase